jgi:hypothetical protein
LQKLSVTIFNLLKLRQFIFRDALSLYIDSLLKKSTASFLINYIIFFVAIILVFAAHPGLRFNKTTFLKAPIIGFSLGTPQTFSFLRGITVCREYQSVCPLVGIGSSQPLPRKRLCLPPWTRRGEGAHSLGGEGVGDPMRTTGKNS